MHLISHRGNISGRNPEKENSPEYVMHALSLGYDVEIDIWCNDNRYFFGHDGPQYEVEKEFINSIKDRSWFHCKNMNALSHLNEDFKDINFFWHENDKCALTSKGYFWCFPGEEILKNSIFLFPENYPNKKNKILLSSGICSDYISNYETYKNIEKIEHNENEIILKLKNPVFNFFKHEKEYVPAENANVRNFHTKLEPINFDDAKSINFDYKGRIFPTVTNFNLNKNNDSETESVFIYPFTPRYYHNMVEIFPKLLKLKKIDPNFIFVLVSLYDTEKWYNTTSSSKDHYYGYLIEFLNLFNIKYRFSYIENLTTTEFKNCYIFYEKFNTNNDGLEQHWHESLSINGHCHSQLFYPCNQNNDTDSLKFLSGYIKEMSNSLELKKDNFKYHKKIFISRKNYHVRKDISTVIKDNLAKEKAIEKVFEENGYHVINMEDFTFLEQLKISHNATHIACFIGSSTYNSIYSDGNVKLLYLNPLNIEYNNELHLKNHYTTYLQNLKIDSVCYDIDMDNKDYSELIEFINRL